MTIPTITITISGESIPQMKEGIAGPEDSKMAADSQNSQNSRLLDLTTDSKLHVLYGGTKIVQHTSPIKTTIALRGMDSRLFWTISECFVFFVYYFTIISLTIITI